ncbi:MAG: hypothetical protein IKA06_01590 [Clostridia bacterium]|nr:hypothetical protein [Clostridia bacterium]
MKIAPRLLHNRNTDLLPNTLFSDLQLDKLLSAHATAVLRHPCEQSEIVRRNALFVLLDENENLACVENALSVLCATERALQLLKDAKIMLDKYYRQVEVLESYIGSCELLACVHHLGDLFADIANYFSSDEKKKLLAHMKQSVQKIKKLLQEMNTGLLSFGDKNWLTPDYDAVSEFDSISACAEALGFPIPKRKPQNIKINLSLSDAMCHLYADKVAHIEAEIAKYADIDFYEPTIYIPEIKFFLEIRNLIQRAMGIGVPHCISKIANTPKYAAKKLYDISLLAKNCENIVPNDADFTENEPFYFLLGANGGGKTTYLRAVGINLILFLAGCPVFAKEAEIYPFDIVLSHFPRDERFDNTGRLDEEKMRTEEMLTKAQNKAAFLFFNETFSGTDDKRGFDLLTDTVAKIAESKQFGLYVTHFHEVMSLDYPILSAEVDLSDANKRTFRIVRSKGSASSYASDILKKYRLDKDSLAARRCGHGN